MHILHVVGTRPNFVKAAPVMDALRVYGVEQTLVHTGQHYDSEMSAEFIDVLGLPQPRFNLAVGSGVHTKQIPEIVRRLQPLLSSCRPDAVFVYGDVNSTLAAALAVSRLGIPVCHVEAGLRSFDRSMPEETNRITIDHASDLLFAHCEDAVTNLKREGVPAERIHLVGNVMIDSLVRFLPLARGYEMPCARQQFALVTLHRASNVDDPCVLKEILKSLSDLSSELDVIFPVHPRTRKRIAEFGIDTRSLRVVDPVPYIQCLTLQQRAAVVITDSGGIQEETTYLNIPCITLRASTERPITTIMGTNVLIDDPARLKAEVRKILNGERKQSSMPPYWDGHASERIAAIVSKHFKRKFRSAAASA